MNKTIKFVVGDVFKGFTCHDAVISVSELKDELARQDTSTQPTHYVLSQGIDQQSDGFLKYLVGCSNTSRPLADGKLTHKHKEHNILITDPEQKSERLYRSDIIIDSRCADISDHNTGAHIQGMVLIEAARQMVTAVTESFYLSEEEKNTYYFVLNNMKSSFSNFAFPLAMTLDCDVVLAEFDKNGNINCHHRMTISQNNTPIAEVEIEFKCYSKVFMAKKEHQIAEKTLNNVMGSLQNQRDLSYTLNPIAAKVTDHQKAVSVA